MGGAGGCDYHREAPLPPGKDAAFLDSAVEHIAAALSSKVEKSVRQIVDRATVQLEANVGRTFDKAQQEAEARVAKLKAEAEELEKRRGARTQETLLLDPEIMQMPSAEYMKLISSHSSRSGNQKGTSSVHSRASMGTLRKHLRKLSVECSSRSRQLFCSKAPPPSKADERRKKEKRKRKREKKKRRKKGGGGGRGYLYLAF
jgi:hypothetical protein